MRITLLLRVVAAAAAAAGSAAAQTAPGSYSVGAHLGAARFDRASAIEPTPYVGVDAVYRLPFGRSLEQTRGLDLGVGFTLTASRPLTDRKQFPVVAFDFGDTTFLYSVAQRLTLLQYGLQGVAGFSTGAARLYGLGGGGLYTFFLDPRQVGTNASVTNPMAFFGGGVDFAFSRAIGLRLEARDVILARYDRARFDPTVSYAVDQRIHDVYPAPPAPRTHANALNFSLVFSYVPNARGAGGATETTPGGNP